MCRLHADKHKLPPNFDADWPVCPYELRGVCRNAQCPFQMGCDHGPAAARYMLASNVRFLCAEHVTFPCLSGVRQSLSFPNRRQSCCICCGAMRVLCVLC